MLIKAVVIDFKVRKLGNINYIVGYEKVVTKSGIRFKDFFNVPVINMVSIIV